ncbi:hypothetical protein, partial [Streptomyces rhizosphaericus]
APAAPASLAARNADDDSALRYADEAVELEHGRDHPQLLARPRLPRGTIQHPRDEPTATLTDLQGPQRELA